MQTPSAREILDGIRGWVEIESQTADLDGVNRVLSHVAEGYAGLGARIERIPGTKGRGDHIVVSSPWGGSGPGVLFLCHLDTVHPKGTLAKDNPFRVEGDRAYGPGTYDMKGGAFLPFAAYRTLKAAGATTPLPVRILYTSDEEVGSPTSRALIEDLAHKAKYVLVTEPARDGGKVVTGRKGVARYIMRAEGRPAHSGSRHPDGRSAIREIAAKVCEIEGWTDYAKGVTFNIGQIHGGTAANTIPQHCWADVDMRIATLADAEAYEARLKALKPVVPDVRLEITGQLNRPPFEKNAGVAALFEAARKLAPGAGLQDFADTYTGGGSDGNFTAPFVPTLDGLGVDGDGAHTLHEHLLVSSLEPRMKLHLALMRTLS